MCVAATWWRLKAFIEPVVTVSGDGIERYPDVDSGPKTVKLNANCVLGSRQGGGILPSRDKSYVMGGEAPAMLRFPIPDQAVTVAIRTIDATGAEVPSGSLLVWSYGADNMIISKFTGPTTANFEYGRAYELPASAADVQVEVTGGGGPYVVTLTWSLFL